MNRWLSISAIVVLLSGLAVADGEQQFANLGTCKVESGETIQDCRVGYRTWGKLNDDKSNVVVVLSWFTGNSEKVGEASIGPDKYVDPAKYFAIVIDALADGVGISPSNSKAQPRMKFPQITIADMVNVEHRLLTESFHLQHVHGVLGASMGGMQSFQWAVQYPTFMDVVIPIVGSTQLTPRDELLWRAEKYAILESKAWNDGNYAAGVKIPAVDDIHEMELTTPDRFNEETLPKDYAAKMQQVESDGFDPSDRIRQMEAMMSLDISRNFDHRMYTATQAVKAKMLIIVSNQDHMVNPAPALHFAEMLNDTPMQLDSDCGHLAPGCKADVVVPAVQKALALH